MQRMLLTLLDGTTVFIRPIAPEDKPLLAAGLRNLSPETAYRRFLSPKVRFSEDELRYLTEVDGHDHIAYVAVDAATTLVAVGRVVRTAPRHGGHGDRRRRPVAGPRPRAPAARGCSPDAAAAEGMTRIAGTMLADNRPALRLHEAASGRGFDAT